MSEHTETRVREIADGLRADNPKLKLFQIVIPGREDEIFLARKASWSEYKAAGGPDKGATGQAK